MCKNLLVKNLFFISTVSFIEEARIKIYLAKERCGGEFEAVRMGFGGLSEEEILEGVEVFGEVWNASIL